MVMPCSRSARSPSVSSAKSMAPADSIHRRFGDGAELILVHSFGIVKEAADQRGLSVVHAAAGEEAEQVLFFLPPQELVDSA